MVLKLNTKAAPEGTQKPAAGSHQAVQVHKPSGLAFLKRGAAAKEEFAKAEYKAEQNSKKKVNRFWVTKGETSTITFLDGNLDADGLLDIPYFYEHSVQMNGKWGHFFVCTQDTEPCPICEGGLNNSYVGLLSVIDHTSYTAKDGKTYKDQVKLFAAKRDTIKQLQIYATKRGGLAGCKFDVSRTGDKSASVGNMFDFTDKSTIAQLKANYPQSTTPINYEEYLQALYLSAKELRKLGFGSTLGPIGSEPDPANSEEYAADL